ncbi:hypothetical protein D3C71_1337830 [compost metagenome]
MHLYILRDYDYYVEEDIQKQVVKDIILLQHTQQMSHDDFDILVRKNRSYHHLESMYTVANNLCVNEGFAIVPMVTF